MKKIIELFLVSFFILASYSISYAQNSMNIIAQFQGENHGSCFGMSMTSLDFNHDGYCDLVISSPGWGYIYPGTTSPSKGKVYIYYGGPNFNSSSPASVTLEGTYNGTTGIRLNNVINVGDINGDGFDDLYIYGTDYGAPSNQVQRLMFFLGGTSNLDTPDHIIYIPQNTSISFLNKLGDVNGDGFDDIGYTYYNTGQYLVFSIIMGGSFVENVVMTYSYYLASGLFTLSGIGDINNDGYADFTIAYTNDDPNTGYHLITIYYGNNTGVFTNFQTLIQTQQPITKISKPLGDMNNDGYDDFMGYISNAGTHVWLGSNNINMNTPSFNLTPGWTGDETSRTLVHGDFNNDGYEDVAGASYTLREADVYLGRAIPNGTSDLMIHQYLYENFGHSLATGDYNADGYCDLAIAASHEDSPWPTGTFYGFVFVYGGNAELADTTVANEDDSIPIPDTEIKVTISPNPCSVTSRTITFRLDGLDKNDIGSIEIYNIKGQRVFQETGVEFSAKTSLNAIQLMNMTSGLYLCHIRLTNKIIGKKLSLIK
jgi:hypothetical protein